MTVPDPAARVGAERPPARRIAVKYDAVRIEDGRVVGLDAAATLVRRVLRVFPGSAVVGPGLERCEGFDLMPLEFCDPARTVVVNMDVIDSLEVWRTLRHSTKAADVEPSVMNLLWWPPSTTTHALDRAALSLSCAVVPTFADSKRTAQEIAEIVRLWTVPALAGRARIAWVNLGFRLDHVQPRCPTPVPTVLYPATSLAARKRPELFLEVVDRVRALVPIRTEVHLQSSQLTRDLALRMSSRQRRDWMWVGPLTATRGDYWGLLARATAFLATSREESYGMAYVEALAAGVVGVFPDLPWAHALLPAGYPLRYRTREEAVALLRRAVTEPEACRREVDAAVGGSLVNHLRAQHSDAGFDRALRDRVAEWFP